MGANANKSHDDGVGGAPLLVCQSAGPRLAAGVVDCLIIVLADFALCLIAGVRIAPDGPLPLVAALGLLVVGFAYFGLCESIWGTTPGKRLFGMTVRMADGGRATVPACLVRTALRIVDTLPCILPFPIGAVVMLRTRRHQRVGDLLAGTLVVDREALDHSIAASTPPPPMLHQIQHRGGAYEQPEPARPSALGEASGPRREQTHRQ
jgi:uncharacterized RDD family membrane protein YckC